MNNNEVKSTGSRPNTGQNRMKSIISTILAFLLSLAFVGITVLLIIQGSCFSRNAFDKSMTESDYYTSVLEDIYDDAEASTLPTGLSVDVLKDTLALSKVQQDVNGYIDASFRGDTYVADTSQWENTLYQNIYDYLTLEGITPSQEQEANIAVHIESLVNIYTTTVQVPLLSQLIKARNLYGKIFQVGIVACILFIGVSLILIKGMNSSLDRSFRYIAYSTIATALMTVIAPTAILISGFYKRIHLSPEYFYNFAITYMTNFFRTFWYYGIGWFAISVIIIVTIQIINKRTRIYE